MTLEIYLTYLEGKMGLPLSYHPQTRAVETHRYASLRLNRFRSLTSRRGIVFIHQVFLSFVDAGSSTNIIKCVKSMRSRQLTTPRAFVVVFSFHILFFRILKSVLMVLIIGLTRSR